MTPDELKHHGVVKDAHRCNMQPGWVMCHGKWVGNVLGSKGKKKQEKNIANCRASVTAVRVGSALGVDGRPKVRRSSCKHSKISPRTSNDDSQCIHDWQCLEEHWSETLPRYPRHKRGSGRLLFFLSLDSRWFQWPPWFRSDPCHQRGGRHILSFPSLQSACCKRRQAPASTRTDG